MYAMFHLRKMSRTRSHRPSRIPTDGERFNERPFVDLCYLVDVRGNRYGWLVAVDQHTDFSVIAPFRSHECQAVAKKIFAHWIRWAGPPDVLVCDGERGLGVLKCQNVSAVCCIFLSQTFNTCSSVTVHKQVFATKRRGRNEGFTVTSVSSPSRLPS